MIKPEEIFDPGTIEYRGQQIDPATLADISMDDLNGQLRRSSSDYTHLNRLLISVRRKINLLTRAKKVILGKKTLEMSKDKKLTGMTDTGIKASLESDPDLMRADDMVADLEAYASELSADIQGITMKHNSLLTLCKFQLQELRGIDPYVQK